MNQRDIPLRIFRKYFDMIKSGVKTVEIRVAYPHLKKIKAGDVFCFNDDPLCRRRVKRVADYKTFQEMMNAEDPKKINPYDSAETQLADIRRIYPPNKERLGVRAFELEAA